MSLSVLLPALAGLALPPPPPSTALDLARIERRLVQEPAYQSGAPKYGLLVFGPQAKTRVWLVLDGNTLYVDRDADGNLAGAGKAVPLTGNRANAGDLAEPDGRARHTRLRLERRGGHVRLMLQTGGKRMQFVGYDEDNPLAFADRPGDAPIIHFDGPLTMCLYGQPPVFVPGQVAEIDACVGTPGLGKGTFAALQCCHILDCQVSPVVEVVFPPQKPGQAPPYVRASIADD
jgi:hypothetical protein